jgi:hypothetical protein
MNKIMSFVFGAVACMALCTGCDTSKNCCDTNAVGCNKDCHCKSGKCCCNGVCKAQCDCQGCSCK